MVRLSRNGPFIRYLTGRGLATAAANLVTVVLGFAVLHFGGNALGVGLVLAGSFGAQAVALPVGGLFGDHLPRRLLVVLSNLVLALVHLTVGATLLVAPDAVDTWMFVIAAVLTGGFQAVARPVYEGLLVELVPAASLQRANSVLRLVLNIARIGIPGLGALLGTWLGYGPVLVAAGTTLLGCTAVFWALPPGWTTRPDTGWLRAARDGWSAFTSRSWLWVFVLRGAVTVPFWLAGYQLLGPVVLADRPDGLWYWGWAVSGFCAGLLVGSLIAARWRPRRLMLAAVTVTAGWPLPLAVLALEVHPGWLIPALLIAGAGLDISIILFHTARQQHVPEHLISRVSAVAQLGEILLVPLGYVLGGLVATLVGAAPVLWLAVAVILGSMVCLLLSSSIRNLTRIDHPATAPEPERVPT